VKRREKAACVAAGVTVCAAWVSIVVVAAAVIAPFIIADDVCRRWTGGSRL
jgi:hypothetical protein